MKAAIREVQERDLPLILPLYAQLGEDDGRILPLAEARQIYRRLQAYPDYRLYLADLAGQAVGVLALLIMDHLGHLGAPVAVVEDLVVHQDYRRRGIGRELLLFAMAQARAKGCYKMALTSNMNRLGAHAFYERLGWRRHGYSFLVELQP